MDNTMQMPQQQSSGGMLGANPAAISPNGMANFMGQSSMSGSMEEQQPPQDMEQQQQAAPWPQANPAPQSMSPMGMQTPHYASGGDVAQEDALRIKPAPQGVRMMPDLDLINHRPGRDTPEDADGKPEMILAHVMANELEMMDKIQGGRSIDPETGLPEYSRLIPMIGTPELVEIFKDVTFELAETGTLNPEKADFISQLDPMFPLADEGAANSQPPSTREDLPFDQEKTLADEGRYGDHELALIPVALADFIDEILGYSSTNPETGLPEYCALAIPAVIAAGAYTASVWGEHQRGKKDERNYRESIAERDRKQAAEDARQKSMVTTLEANRAAPRTHMLVPSDRILSPDERAQGLGKGFEQPHFEEQPINEGFSKGGTPHGKEKPVNAPPLRKSGIIKGPGKGQDDLIATTVPNESYIIDASTLSNIGDGSSDAGARVFDIFVKKLKKSGKDFPSSDRQRHAAGGSAEGDVPVYVANDEYLIEPPVVDALGGGSNAQGAKLLKQMVKNIRIHKTSNGTGLPPKAKNLFEYFSKARGN